MLAIAEVDQGVEAVDRFGNLVTDIETTRLPFARFTARAGAHTIARMASAYGEAGDGPFLITGSSGCVEISVANGSAAELLRLSRGDRVTVVPA